TRDPKALSHVSATSELAYDSKALTLKQLQLRLDETQINGNLKLPTGDAEPVKFDLAVDQIDLDRYRAPQSGPPAPPAADHLVKPDKPWDAKGTLTIKAAQLAHLDLSDVRLTLSAKDKVVHLFPIEAQVDGGRFSGDITFDSRGATPMLSVDEQLTGIDMSRLLANAAGKGRLSGRATLNLKATARADSVD